ncbi:hypothetical protein Adeg_0168 [Ammonifex degensii KC4]|uniref:Sporulation protein YtxC n=1 Tax=Ammonifex degensii (strain DSM 10501 / KC4) TaxID=429009 RepID=C9RAR3_AMMDK|nr:sporulation protein YtxC [Ammonifex degensii]ACX51340.1 hypothetical protein Adeg_0168 [Ammonifex degensii KC4]
MEIALRLRSAPLRKILREGLARELQQLRKERIPCRLDTDKEGDLLWVKVEARSESERRYVKLRLGRFLEEFFLCHGLTLYFHSLWEGELPNSPVLQQAIREALSSRRKNPSLAPFRSLIAERLSSYLRSSSSSIKLDLEGFLYFRLKELRLPLSRLAYEVVDEALFYQESEELLDFLTSFRQRHGASYHRVHCYRTAAGGVLLCDGKGKELAYLSPSDFPEEEGPEDWILGTLILLGARQIVLHGYFPSSTALPLFTRLFRLKECRGCSLCAVPKLKENRSHQAKEP